MMREVFRSQGLDPTRFVPPTAPKITPPELGKPGPEAAIPEFTPNPAQEIGMQLQAMANPQMGA